MRSSLDKARQQTDALSNQFKTVTQNGGGQKSFNYDNYHLLTGHCQKDIS